MFNQVLLLTLCFCCCVLQIVPADLNAFLYQIERNIAWGANLTGNASLSDEYNKLAMMRYEAINALLWNETTGGASCVRSCVIETCS